MGWGTLQDGNHLAAFGLASDRAVVKLIHDMFLVKGLGAALAVLLVASYCTVLRQASWACVPPSLFPAHYAWRRRCAGAMRAQMVHANRARLCGHDVGRSRGLRRQLVHSKCAHAPAQI